MEGNEHMTDVASNPPTCISAAIAYYRHGRRTDSVDREWAAGVWAALLAEGRIRWYSEDNGYAHSTPPGEGDTISPDEQRVLVLPLPEENP